MKSDPTVHTSSQHSRTITKRDGSIVPFDESKIAVAVEKAMKAVGNFKRSDAEKIAHEVVAKLDVSFQTDSTLEISVERIQDLVELSLMESNYHEVAKAYILYRDHRAQLRKRDIFKKRINLKPHEYPELLEYVDAIRHSYWIHTEFNFTSDIQDFKVHVNEAERGAITRAMLAIAQIEVAVKTFWGDVYKKMPKPEIGSVGFTFAESEVRHQDAYAHLLEILGLNHEFEKVRDIPVIMKRINYLERSIKNARSDDNREYAQAILLFSLFIEHVSLFSQFLIIMSFNKHKNLFKGISNVIEATSKEEQIHGLFGIDLINIIKNEHPEWFDDTYNESIMASCKEAFEAESAIVDWIFEQGEINCMPAITVKEFIKNRFNNSLASIGLPRIFPINEQELEKTEWFDDEVIATKHGDFFVKRSINYNKRSKSITESDLF
ncbi:MAG: ribonucleotide-diphosphate reductase subunit beta [Candidatus Pacebacteria bacterium]|nr:ribonucleotide-diphosphate reductase subunit beta [Candidatus Paceibacterota bacterium]